MIWNSLQIYSPIVFGSVLASLFTLFILSVNVSAQDAPNYLFGNLGLESNLTREQLQELGDKITNYTSTMLKEANGNDTKLNVLLVEDLAKRNIIDEETKQGFLSFIANIPKPPMEGLPDIIPGNVTLLGNSTDFLKDLDSSSALLDEIANNNTGSQLVTLMTDILKKRVTDIGTLISGNGTDTGMVTISSEFTPGIVGKGVACAFVGMALSGGSPLTALSTGLACANLIA